MLLLIPADQRLGHVGEGEEEPARISLLGGTTCPWAPEASFSAVSKPKFSSILYFGGVYFVFCRGVICILESYILEAFVF